VSGFGAVTSEPGTCADCPAPLPTPRGVNKRLCDSCVKAKANEREHAKTRTASGAPRSKTIAPKRLTKEEIRISETLTFPKLDRHPATRGGCLDVPRPCPFVSCKHHLYLDVNPETGSIKLNFPDKDPDELAETCSLDVADAGGITLEEVGELLNLTRERVRQVEVRGLVQLRREASK
jgi:hypothetical protein